MAHSRVKGGVQIDDSKTSYQVNPGVGYTLGGGFHCTTFECIAQIFREGLRPGGGGDRINAFFVPFAPWDERSQSVLKFKYIPGADLVYIYLTYESLSSFSPRVSADGHILVQQTIPFNSFDAVWFYDHQEGEYYRLMVNKGGEQLVLSVKGAKKVAATVRFDSLLESLVYDEASSDLSELRKLMEIKTNHVSGTHRLFPKHPDWNDAISLLALTHRPNKEGHRLCPACLCETPAVLSICTICKGYLISHGWRRRIKVTVASFAASEPRPQDDEVKEHVKQAWEKVKVDLTSDDDDDDDIAQEGDGDVNMESTPDEAQASGGGADQNAPEDDLKAEKRDFREQDDVDQFVNEQVEKGDDSEGERAEDEEIDLGRYEAGEAVNVEEDYPAWLERIQFGSKVLPVEPCLIGDAQPELIKILLLQIGMNLLKMYKQFCRNWCGPIEQAWQYFQTVKEYRLDLDPRVPYLGEDENGRLIEPTVDQVKELYARIRNPRSKEDIGEEGFISAYHGSLVFKKLITYVLECGYALSDLQTLFTDEKDTQLSQWDSKEEELKKSASARDALDEQTTFVRRIIAGAYKVNAVYFFRNVDFQNTVLLNPTDIICACRPIIRRISVMHLILQNGKQLPGPLIDKLYSAIDEYNRLKKRDNQRPRWGVHISEAHIAAIADTPVPAGARTDAEVRPEGKSKAAPKAVAKASSSTPDDHQEEEAASTPRERPTPTPKYGKGRGKEPGHYSHRGGDWNYSGRYTGQYYGRRNW